MLTPTQLAADAIERGHPLPVQTRPDAGLAAVLGWLDAALENLDDTGVVVEHFPAPENIPDDSEVDRNGAA